MSSDDVPLAPPGTLRRAAAGAWHVPAALALLLRTPALWGAAAAPVALTAVLLGAGLFVGVYTIGGAERWLAGLLGPVPDLLGLLVTLALWLAVLGAGLAVGLALALLLSAPLLDRLGRRVERLALGQAPEGPGLVWEIGQALRSALFFVGAAPVAFLLGLLPLVGPLFGLAWAAWALAFQLTDAPLQRRGRDFAARRAWHRRWWAEALGFGLAAVLMLAVPLANLLLAPVLAIAAARLVLELDHQPRG